MTDPALQECLENLRLRRMGSATTAGLCIASVPLPRGHDGAISLSGMPTARRGLGQWWNEAGVSPRRALLIGDPGGRAPFEIGVSGGKSIAPKGQVPTADAEVFASSKDPDVFWERHQLRISWGGRSIALAMGMRVGGDVRWWEFCRLIELRRSAEYVEVEMGGSIPHIHFTGDDLRNFAGYRLPGLHQHHWLTGIVTARLHANGVCEVVARHVNSKFFDDGLPLKNAVPVVGFHADHDTDIRGVRPGDWDGSVADVTIGDARLDLTDASHMASVSQPGRFDYHDGFVIWQPYLGMELFGGLCPKQLTDDGFIFHAKDQIIPRGMSRTLRFSLSLNPDRPANVVRYLAPSWWYSLCEETTPFSTLPVSDRLDEVIEACSEFPRKHMVRKTFEDGSLPRGIGQTIDDRHEPGWEGEAAGAAMLLAYRTGDASDYDDAMRICYCFHDVYIDHAAKAVRMHGFAPNAFSVPMNRIHGCVMAFLETGDDFCLNSARAVIENSYWTHKNSWPRMAVGRDACFIRGAVLLYRYLNDAHFLDIARDSIRDVVASQRPEGWFGDQGGGSGLHGWAAYICKPWMGLMAVGGLLDFLDLFPDGDPAALACVKKFADWLMAERFDHNGVMGWSYQHWFNGKREFRTAQTGEVVTLPGRDLWHVDYLARLMTFCTLRFNDVSYYDAWLESFDGVKKSRLGDHGFTQSVHFLPWTQARTWNATLGAGGEVIVKPTPLSARAPRQGKVHAPSGVVVVDRGGKAS